MAVEFALVLAPLLLLIFCTLQLAVIYVAQGLIESATEIASREISTGTAQTSNMTAAQFKSGLCAPLSALFECAKLMIDVRVVSSISPADAAYPKLTFDSSGGVSKSWTYNPGVPGDLVVLRLMYQWPTVAVAGMDLSNLPNGMRFLVGTAVIRNERYQ